MRKYVSAIFSIICLFLVTQSPLVNSQTPLPEIHLTCDPSIVQIDVYPGATTTGFVVCTVTNNSAYLLDVDITVTTDLDFTSPGSVTVGASSTIDFEVSLKSEVGACVCQWMVNVEALVVSVNGIPYDVTEEKAEVNILASARQYSSVSISTPPQVEINSGGTQEATYTITNNGNGRDILIIGFDSFSRDLFEDEGFLIVQEYFRIEDRKSVV